MNDVSEYWKTKAERLFFIDHLPITKICAAVGRSRQHVARHLSSCTGFKEEKERRKEENAIKRKEDKRRWDREHRSRQSQIEDHAMLMNDHYQAVAELSHEKYH